MKNVLKIFAILVLGFVGYVVYILLNPISPKDTVVYNSDDANFEVVYSRPYKKDRLIFGSEENGALVPFGKYWRTGANANTKISFSDPVRISGVTIPAGTYALYTRPGKTMWEVFFYKKSDNWALPKVWDINQISVEKKNDMSRLRRARQLECRSNGICCRAL